MGLAISVNNVSKSYRVYPSPRERLKELLHPFGKKYHRDFWALTDISLEIEEGESVGIIGRNGSGKSTLLQVICAILPPTKGEVSTKGRISALLELGAGFNKEFSGRDNVFLQGSIMGIPRKEMQERFDDIAAFAEIGHFIEQPVKTYSSGMYIRLAFAVAINVNPDILIVDEALAVGDAMFQRRCYKKIEEFKEKGKTLIFVTHGPDLIIRLCDRALLLDKGKAVAFGKSKDVVNVYTKLLAEAEEAYLKQLKGKHKKITSVSKPQEDERLQNPEDGKGEKVREYRIGTGDAEITDVKMLNKAGESVRVLEKGEECTVRFVAHFNEDVNNPATSMNFKTLTGIVITGAHSLLDPIRKGSILTSEFKFKVPMNPGSYSLTVVIEDHPATHRRHVDLRRDVMVLRVYGEPTVGLVDTDILNTNTVEPVK